ncbi:ADP-ribosylglycohydrolase family protein [Paracoccus actinidiae]|uniref:ADP-ribosylglycohydrolase family protein n=1 Tax=Paracoccus actinidiae TaxID=3064531 RepID=UPI0027D21CDC|nr:ADP-ribosylglycohydrolase family protein [Paracoccus sp. M09]
MIDSFDVAAGRLGMTLCPGRRGAAELGSDWARDLGMDVLRLKLWRTDILVSLIEDAELQRLVDPESNMDQQLREAGILWLRLPIPKGQAPDADWYQGWRAISPVLHQRLEAGGRVVVHGLSGRERTGLVAALIQCERGERVAEALAHVARTRKGAGPLPVQRRWLEALMAEDDPVLGHIRASLYGGAIGDALGAEIEFWSLDKIRTQFPDGVDRILPHDGVQAAITDDTQMTLFTGEGLVRAMVRAVSKGMCHPPGVVHHALLRWYLTQGGRSPIDWIDSIGLIRDPRLHRRRAPGTTCLSALSASRAFGDLAQNDSKGCGTIMRVAPVGLFQRDHIDALADETSHLTHGHRTGRDAARAFAWLLSFLLEGETLSRALDRLQGKNLDLRVMTAIDAARAARLDGLPGTVESLGGGWVAEEALSIAIYAALAARDFEEGLRIAVTHSGDSDSTGAIAGNLLGLLYSEQVMGHPWRRQIECPDLIGRIAMDLHRARCPDADFARDLWRFYPGV